MFLDTTVNRNRALIETAYHLHQSGQIYPNSYVIDLDIIRANTKVMAAEAAKYQIRLIAMTKQLGRNPVVAKAIAQSGIDSFIAVDPWEALTLARAGLHLANVGHIVQIPKYMLSEIIGYKPDYITVYSAENALLIARAAKELNVTQKILIKVDDDFHTSYPGQEGGIPVSELLSCVENISKMEAVEIAGLTAFPCLLYNEDIDQFEFTKKAEALVAAKNILAKHGYSFPVLNVPSANSTTTFKMISEFGGNLLEPGHAISGTTPIHAVSDQPELPALVYVSEVSHKANDKAYLYGGGNYARGHVKSALAGNSINELLENRYDLSFPPSENIDYYAELSGQATPQLEVGDTVIAAFRTQIFVTRSQVVPVSGIQSGNPKIEGIFDSQGNPCQHG